MSKRYPQTFLAWMIVLSLGVILSSCSPQKTVSKYGYLITERPELRPEVKERVHTTLATPVTNMVAEHTPVAVTESRPERRRRRVRNENQEMTLVIETARSYLGTPYRYGGMSRLGVDCSGLMCLSYQSVNKALPRTSKAMADSGRTVGKEELEPGHLVFFDAKNGHNINHVGMVVASAGGEVQFIHASSSAGVRIDRLEDPYWSRRFRRAVAP